MTLRAHWEIAAIPDSLFQGVLLASLPEAPEEMEVLITRTQNLTSHHCSVQHQAADMLLLWWLKPACCWGKVGCLQAWQLPVCNSPHPTLRKTLKKLQLLCMFFPDASATSRAPEPNQAPQEIAQGAPEHYMAASEGRISNLGLSYCREVLKQTPLCWCHGRQVQLVAPISGMLRQNNLHRARLGWLCRGETLKILLLPWPSGMYIRTAENNCFLVCK